MNGQLPTFIPGTVEGRPQDPPISVIEQPPDMDGPQGGIDAMFVE
ncbi:hypothetical protein [Rhizobium leguminosarum]|nr:hypothetical protein [Rhizobium leguminosarum]